MSSVPATQKGFSWTFVWWELLSVVFLGSHRPFNAKIISSHSRPMLSVGSHGCVWSKKHSSTRPCRHQLFESESPLCSTTLFENIIHRCGGLSKGPEAARNNRFAPGRTLVTTGHPDVAEASSWEQFAKKCFTTFQDGSCWHSWVLESYANSITFLPTVGLSHCSVIEDIPYRKWYSLSSSVL